MGTREVCSTSYPNKLTKRNALRNTKNVPKAAGAVFIVRRWATQIDCTAADPIQFINSLKLLVRFMLNINFWKSISLNLKCLVNSIYQLIRTQSNYLCWISSFWNLVVWINVCGWIVCCQYNILDSILTS